MITASGVTSSTVGKPVLSEADLRRLLAKVDTLQPEQARVLLQGLAEEINERCAQDGIFWLRFVKTRDEADPSSSVKPFPVHLEYTTEIWRELVTKQRVVIAKSRQMLISWLIACFCVWWARYKPNQAIYWQTKKWEDATAAICLPAGGVKARCQFIEDNLPAWMRVAYKPIDGQMEYPNGSIIKALAGGADQIRGKVASIVVEDEFAFAEDQDGVYTSVAPLIQKGAKAFFISTPNGTDNMFATLYHGRSVATEQPA